jgi:hypothetical protein
MLDYSIRDPLAPFISHGFYGWTGSLPPLAKITFYCLVSIIPEIG